MLEGVSIFVVGLVVFIIITLMAGIRQVPQGKNYTVELFRRYNRTLTPGLNVIIPYIETIGNKVVMMEQVMDVPTQEVITRDNATVRADGVVFYQIIDAARASYEVADLTNALMNLTTTNIRTVMGSMDLDQLLSHRDEINVKSLPWSTPRPRPGALRSRASRSRISFRPPISPKQWRDK